MSIELMEWTRDKPAAWGSGPWNDEVDKKQWEHKGVACLILRHGSLGHWCGYVGVPEGHKLHGMSYNDAYGGWSDEEPHEHAEFLRTVCDASHCGLTFAAACQGEEDPSEGVCHIAEEEVWWFGFDCAHSGDKSPGMPLGFGEGEHYMTQPEVEGYVQRMAEAVVA